MSKIITNLDASPIGTKGDGRPAPPPSAPPRQPPLPPIPSQVVHSISRTVLHPLHDYDTNERDAIALAISIVNTGYPIELIVGRLFPEASVEDRIDLGNRVAWADQIITPDYEYTTLGPYRELVNSIMPAVEAAWMLTLEWALETWKGFKNKAGTDADTQFLLLKQMVLRYQEELLLNLVDPYTISLINYVLKEDSNATNFFDRAQKLQQRQRGKNNMLKVADLRYTDELRDAYFTAGLVDFAESQEHPGVQWALYGVTVLYLIGSILKFKDTLLGENRRNRR